MVRAVMADHLQASPRRRRAPGRKSWASSIRARVLLIVLIPSATMLITGAAVAGNLISQGLSARNLSGYLRQNVGPIADLEYTVARERTISLRFLGGNPQAKAGLPKQWQATDALLNKLRQVGNATQGLNSGAAGANATFHKLLAQLPVIRQGVQSRQLTPTAVDAFYTQLTNVASPAFLQFALSAHDPVATVDGITMLDLMPVVDGHSRAVGLGSGWASRGVLSQPDRLVVAQLTGAYRNQLQQLLPRLTTSEMTAYNRLVAGSAWQLAMAGEDELAQNGKLAMSDADWINAEQSVSAGLTGMWRDSFSQAQSSAETAANATLSRAVLLGSVVMALSVAAFAAAMLLANGLVRRLRRLRAKTLELADEKLPSMVRRIGEGELVDPESEMTKFDSGDDEIGQVAEAFLTAQRTAVEAAVAEAKTRSGIHKVFLDIAHRSQLVVHRQLELLDVAEAKQSDPEHLERLFQLDHLATRARRNAENLVILGGGQPGRRWRKPAALEDIARSAVSETEHFARVNTVRLPSVQVQGAVVGDLIHLLAELVDNATVFSPPDAAVTVRGNLVGKGVVVEVEDQGLGIKFAERERLNETLAHPPDFQAMALSGQRHLGLFVVGQLAQRHGISVSLLESAYGGIKAIVLIPANVIESDGIADGDSSTMVGAGRHEQPRKAVPAEAAGATPLPQLRGERRNVELPRRPGQEPPADHARSLPPWPDLQAPAHSPRPRQTAPGPGRIAPQSQPQSAPPGVPPGPSRRGRAPLPRRERQANLAPGLRMDAEAPQNNAPRLSRSPEERRSSMSAFQRGTRMGRDSSAQDNR